MMDWREWKPLLIFGGVALLILLGLFSYMLIRVNEENQKTNRVRYNACKTITDERLRDDCLTGGYYIGNGGN